MDEPALRLSARIQILGYLSAAKVSRNESKALAATLASEAIADFADHHDEVPLFMADRLLGYLSVWIEKYEPQLQERFKEAMKKADLKVSDDRIDSALSLKDGDRLTVGTIVQRLEEGRDINGLVFYLTELFHRDSVDLLPLLSQILTIAERGSSPSISTLYWLTEIYRHPKIPKYLQQRFLRMIIARTHQVNVPQNSVEPTAYDLLTLTLPSVRELTPELYDQALTHSFAMRSSLNEVELMREARVKRLRESLSPIEDLIAEAEASKSKGVRNELLAEAAQLALNGRKLTLTLDIVDRLELESGTGFWRSWSDQFLKEFVNTALEAKNPELAEKGAALIGSNLAKVEVLVKIMHYSARINDRSSAQRFLIDARKIADAVTTDLHRVKAFLVLSLNCDPADPTQQAPLLESGIKSLNNMSKPDAAGKDRRAQYELYLRDLEIAANDLRKSFRGLTTKDENGAIALNEKVQKSDLRTFAMIGILGGLDVLMTSR